MCGIAGGTAVAPEVLRTMLARVAHRGPDADGTWQEGGVGLAHARLAIIDPSPDARQPMLSPDGRLVISYNGELYNYRALRAELEAVGERFATQSDTEVLLRLLAREGEAALPKLVGMFAFALWDRENEALLLARDRLGIKPLVWGEVPGGIAFASEIRALEAHPGIDLTLDREALSQYLACLYVPAPLTMRKGIRKLPPGHLLRWQRGVLEGPAAWWRPRVTGDRHLSLDEAVEEVLPVLRRAVRDHLVSDVPVGCFLSGGIDSSVVAALVAETGPPRTFTMTFAEPAYDERDAAAVVANHVHSWHTELPASPEVDLALLLDRFGEPFGNPTAFLVADLARKAREHVTVALVGDGGDEVFGGYPRYEGGLLAQKWRHLPRPLRRAAAAASRFIPESRAGRHSLRRAREFLVAADLPDAEMYASWAEYFTPGEREEMLGFAAGSPIAARYLVASSPHPLDAMQETDLATFLPGNILAYGDAMSMARALELRLPLLDHRLVEAVGRFPPALRQRKRLLRAVARRLLPAEIVDRPKRGFNAPIGLWLEGPLKPLAEAHLRPERLERLGIAWAPVKRLLSERGRDHSVKLWGLIVLSAWADR
jgi:asparagine synthase (glutamine-hydrolysing)